ncbi:hypothetical protein MHA_0957 [Mannheimia haemolytica PHL213]|nr:hypothetical protein MHA_0957 [Mannheimia haemolytica PHL213]
MLRCSSKYALYYSPICNWIPNTDRNCIFTALQHSFAQKTSNQTTKKIFLDKVLSRFYQGLNQFWRENAQ